MRAWQEPRHSSPLTLLNLIYKTLTSKATEWASFQAQLGLKPQRRLQKRLKPRSLRRQTQLLTKVPTCSTRFKVKSKCSSQARISRKEARRDRTLLGLTWSKTTSPGWGARHSLQRSWQKRRTSWSTEKSFSKKWELKLLRIGTRSTSMEVWAKSALITKEE